MHPAIRDAGFEAILIRILRRRKTALLVPMAIGLLIAAVRALYFPVLYEAEVTLLYKSQEVSLEFIPNTIDQLNPFSMQAAFQGVLSQGNIRHILSQMGGYTPPAPGLFADPDPIKRFRKSVTWREKRAEVTSSGGRVVPGHHSVEIAFRDESPIVARDIVILLAQSLRYFHRQGRLEQAAGVEDFIASQMQEAANDLLQFERQIAGFRERHTDNLPEHYQANLNALARMESAYLDMELMLWRLRARKLHMQPGLARLNPTLPVILASGQRMESDLDRFKSLEARYRIAAARYRDSHPAMVRMAEELDSLSDIEGVATDEAELAKQLYYHRNHLSALRGRYTDIYPDLVDAQRVVAELERRAAAEDIDASSVPKQADNPDYIAQQIQLDDLDAKIETAQQKLAQLGEDIEEQQRLVASAPQIEGDFAALRRDHTIALRTFNRLEKTLRELNMKVKLEESGSGLGFQLREPPAVPTQPVGNSRPLMFLFFVLSGALVGLVVASLREMNDPAIWSVEQLHAVAGEPPLVAIPYIHVPREKGRFSFWR